jgi:hypothetical protein
VKFGTDGSKLRHSDSKFVTTTWRCRVLISLGIQMSLHELASHRFFCLTTTSEASNGQVRVIRSMFSQCFWEVSLTNVS